jgi:hypothetical protein
MHPLAGGRAKRNDHQVTPHPRGDREIEQLAVDAIDGRIFGLWDLSPLEPAELAMQVFLPLGHLKAEQARQQRAAGYVTGYARRATARENARVASVAVPGGSYPVFESMTMLTAADAQRLERALAAERRRRAPKPNPGLLSTE